MESIDSVVNELSEEHEKLSLSVKEREEQLEALLQAILILSEYSNQVSLESKDNNESSDIANSAKRERNLKELSELNKEWNLEETGVPILLSRIDKLKSHIRVISKGFDTSEEENLKLKDSLVRSKELNLVLKNCFQNVQKENIALKRALEKKSRERDRFLKLLKELSSKARQDADDNEKMTLKLKAALHEQNMSNVNGRPYDSSASSDDELSHISNLSSQSTIFDDGVATVSFYSESCNSSSSNGVSNENQPSPNFTLKKRKTLEITIRSKSLGLQFLLLPHSYDSKEFNQKNITTNNATQGQFLVCGFNGFDDSHNPRPELGAKLISIDNINMETTNFSISELNLELTSRLATRSPFTLAFRNDKLSPAQTEALNKAITTTNDSCVTTGIYKISMNEKPRNEFLSQSQSHLISPYSTPRADPSFASADSEDREDPNQSYFDDSIIEEDHLPIRNLDAIHNGQSPKTNFNVSTRSLNSDSSVLREWNSSPSPKKPTAPTTPVLREWKSVTNKQTEEITPTTPKEKGKFNSTKGHEKNTLNRKVRPRRRFFGFA